MSPPTLSPPSLHFMIIDFLTTCGVDEFTFWCKTDTPCHLTLHLSIEKPIVRRIPYQKRGADFELSSVTCFVEIATYDQDEAGDTTIHTFTIPLVAYDLPHYWYLTGTQGGVPCKSISQIFHITCSESLLPPTQVYEYSTPRDYVAALNFRTNACDSNLGSGKISDFVAISDHPLNRVVLRVRQYHYWYPKCGAEVLLFAALPTGKITGPILTYGYIPSSSVPPYPTDAIINLDVPLVHLIGGQRYAWTFFAWEMGDPLRVSMVMRGQSPNYASTQDTWHLCRTTYRYVGLQAPNVAYFQNWIINP